MSNPSLILPQSPAYGEDYVYAAQVNDGVVPLYNVLPLTFTRASNGTRINKDGILENMPYNLLQQSETFNVSPWAVSLSTISANATIAPNGTTTADKLVEDTSNGTHQVYQEVTPSGSIIDQYYTFSCYAKAGERTKISLYLQTPSVSEGTFDLVNGTASITGGTGTAGVAIESVGNGWYRCSIYRLNTSGGYVYTNVFLNDGASRTYTGNGISGAYIWGAQLNIGSTAKPYLATTDRLNMPRITYPVGGGCGALLLEKQSTNLLSYSNGFDNAYWNKTSQGVGSNAVITPNYTTSPDGTNNAFRFQCNLNGGTTTSDRSWMLASFTAQATSTISMYIKLNSAGTKTFVFSDSGGNTTTISNTNWQRIDRVSSGASGEFRIGLIGGLGTSDTLDCSIAFAQAEGSSYATSYIPTTSTSATRIVDVCSKTGISNLIGQSEGVLFVDFNFTGNYDNNGNVPIVVYDGSNEAYIFITGAGTLRLELYNGGTLQCLITTSIGAVGRKKIAFAYKQNDFVGYMNGTQIGTDTSGTVGAMTTINIGSYYVPNYSINGEINQVVLYPTRLTNAELATLTTI